MVRARAPARCCLWTPCSSKLALFSGCLPSSQDSGSSSRFHVLTRHCGEEEEGLFSIVTFLLERKPFWRPFPECFSSCILGPNKVTCPFPGEGVVFLWLADNQDPLWRATPGCPVRWMLSCSARRPPVHTRLSVLPCRCHLALANAPSRPPGLLFFHQDMPHTFHKSDTAPNCPPTPTRLECSGNVLGPPHPGRLLYQPGRCYPCLLSATETDTYPATVCSIKS